MKKCLVTGGAGFIGSHLVDRLLANGHEVVVVDNLFSGKIENLKKASGYKDQFVFKQEDITDLNVCHKLVKDVEVVFHQAAVGSVPRSVLDPHYTHHVNTVGTLNILWASKNAGVKKVINAASSSAYGGVMELPKKESHSPIPLSPYAVSKLTQEHYCRAFYESYGLQTISMRYFNVYGPRQDPLSQYAAVIPRFFFALLNNEQPTIHGDGHQTRDFTFVHDVVQANLLAMNHEQACGQVYNVAGGGSISINQLFHTIAAVLKVQALPKYLDSRKGDVRHSQGDGSLILKDFQWKPSYSLEDGLKNTHEWILENRALFNMK